MQNYKITLLALILCYNTFGQVKMTDFKISSQFIPTSHYKEPYEDTLNTAKTKKIIYKRRDSKSYQSRYNLELNFNLSTKIDTTPGSVKMWNAMVNSDHLILKNMNYDVKVFPNWLSATSLTFQHYRTLKNHWAFVGIISAGLNTEYFKVNQNDIFAFGAAMWVKSFSSKFSLGIGLMVHNNFGKPLPWPLITVNYEMGQKFKLKIDIPDKAPGLAYKISLTYAKNKKYDFSAFFNPSTMAYDIDYSLDNKRLFNYWQIPIGTQLDTHSKHFDLSFNYGLMVLRSFAYADKKLAKMFEKYPYHPLTTNMFFGFNIKYKL